MRSRRAWSTLAGLSLVLAACGDSVESRAGNGAAGVEAATEQGTLSYATIQGGRFHPDGWPGVPAEFDPDLFDPVAAGGPPPDSFRQVLQRDWIAPVYDPTFVEASIVDWPDEELVIGVDLDGEARAYPVGFLNRREIVVDMHRGIPTFVTW